MDYKDLEEERRKSWGKEKPYKGSNIIILGVGHSGTTILTEMIAQLGWDLNDGIDDTYLESPRVRDSNENFLCENSTGTIDGSFLLELTQPWVIKDPRFVFTLSQWSKVFQDKLSEMPLVIYLKRNKKDVLKSYKKRGEDSINYGFNQFKTTVSEAILWSLKQYEAWPGPKCMIDYEDIATSCELFKQPL